MMQFLKLTAKTGHACLINVRHIIDITEFGTGDFRLVTTTEAGDNGGNQLTTIKETMYQIEQAMDHLVKFGVYAVAVAAEWPAEEPGGGDEQ